MTASANNYKTEIKPSRNSKNPIKKATNKLLNDRLIDLNINQVNSSPKARQLKDLKKIRSYCQMHNVRENNEVTTKNTQKTFKFKKWSWIGKEINEESRRKPY